ncbi:hypothetical protein ACFRAE_10735 [Sphingobacterium sp. HJSM2_6]|uniref:hypothetical protein n=1 Tax=Sphingobacterium sp. HJSM2_6 TaxID=3366264 RepID=UPI003BC4B0E9
MNFLSSFSRLFFITVPVVIACSSATDVGQGPNKTEQKVDTITLVDDEMFAKGLILKRGNPSESPGNIYPFLGSPAQPDWELAEWGTKFFLTEDDKLNNSNLVSYQNEGKQLSFHTGANKPYPIQMNLLTSKEYTSPRKYGEFWPHLLIEQAFKQQPAIKDLKELRLKFKGKLTKSELKMKASEFDKGLHTAQFQLFLSIQNLNKNSAYYGDYVWFGIPFYDYRYEKIPLYASQDVAKDDATGKFIYSLASETHLGNKTFHHGDEISVDIDLFPYIIKAIQTAKQRGFLTGSLEQEFKVSGMNLGWEVPGTFDVGFEISKFNLTYINKN